jgi:hypothetical protein
MVTKITRFRLGSEHKMSNDNDQKAIDNMVRDIKGLFTTGNGPPGATITQVLYADVENGKTYAKSEDAWIEIGNT